MNPGVVSAEVQTAWTTAPDASASVKGALSLALLAIIDGEADRLCDCLQGPTTAWRRAIVREAMKRAVKRALNGA